MDSRLTSSIAVPPNQTSVLLPHSLPGRLYKVSVMPRTRLMQAPLSVNGSCLGDSLPRLQEVVLAPGRPAAPVITSLTIDADNVVTLSWQQLLDEEWNGVPTSYHVKLFIVNASEVNAHGTQLQLKILNTSVNSFSFDLNRTVPSSLADHNLFRVGVRAMNHDVRGQQHWVGHLSSRLIWSKCIEPVQNLSSVIEWHNEGILISWTYPRARGDSGLLAPSEDGDAMFFYDLEVCSSSSCLHHRAVSGTLNYTIALSQSRLCDVRNVSVRPCTGLDRTLCGDPRMFWWQQQPLEVLFSDQDTLVEIAGSYQYYWSVDISLAPYEVGLENKSSEVLALYIDYLQGNRSFKQQAVLFDVGSADTLNLSTATRELEFGARHVFSYAVFTADLPPARAIAFDASNSSRDTRQLSPAPPANWSLDTGSGKVELELPTDDTIPGAFYQVMAMPVSADVVPVRHRLQTRHRARRQVAASASGTAASVSEPIPGLVDGVQYEIWVQRCVPLPSPSTETACGSWSDRKWVVAGIAAATSPPTTSATVSSSSQATTTPTVELLPPTASSGTSFSTLLTIGIAAFVGLLCVVVSLIFFCKGRQYRRDNLMKTSSPHSPYDYTSIASPMNHGNGSVLHPKITMIKEKHLQLTDILGHGEFGNVHKGQYTGDGGRAQVIAAKVLKDQAGDEDKQALLEEITLMSVIAEQGEHENVIGMVVGGFFRGLPCMVMEYMDIGDLHSYLDRHRLSHDPKSSNLAVLCTTLSSKELMSFASQVARGMEHLSVKVQVVHRDLAARNILIQSTGGDQLNLKVADFGLARSIYRRINYKRAKGTRVPLKWLAIESLREDIYTAASDVWSFGILMWEIVTLGGHPYPGIPLGRLCQFLESGYRMARPRYCSREVYSMMRRCWEADPKLRPSFTELVDQLDILLASSAGYIHVEANIHAVQPDIIDEVSDSDSDADSPAQRWPMDAYSELTTPGFACTPDGYLAPKDSGPAFIMPDPLPASSNGDVRGIATGGADDIESGAAVDGGGGSGVHSRQGSRRGASRRQSSVKSHRTSVVQSLLPSAIQRMISSAAGSIFRAPSVDSLDRGLAKTQQQQQQQASAEASTSSMATANGLRSPRSLIQRRHSSSDVPSDDSSVTLTDIRRLSSTDSSSNADKCDGSAAVARSTSNASNKPAVVSRLNWPSKLTSQRESVEYTTVVSPPVAVHAVKPANTPPSKPALPPKPPRVVVSPKNSASSSASPRGSRRKPNLVLPGYIQPSPAVSNESIARSKAGSQDTLGDVFESKSNSVESLSRLPANPISQSYGSQGSSHLTQVKPASSLPSLG
ncbi:uncharacterized protein LOC135818135 [Sycon ciliatum]|uniref:uncharacterized protein LOC135818135 n=1 Tax=Sycon ciliatum TaxID=27933 RepID=UPI0031F649B5